MYVFTVIDTCAKRPRPAQLMCRDEMHIMIAFRKVE